MTQVKPRISRRLGLDAGGGAAYVTETLWGPAGSLRADRTT